MRVPFSLPAISASGVIGSPLTHKCLEPLRKACLFLLQLPMNIIGRTSEGLFCRISALDLCVLSGARPITN